MARQHETKMTPVPLAIEHSWGYSPEQAASPFSMHSPFWAAATEAMARAARTVLRLSCMFAVPGSGGEVGGQFGDDRSGNEEGSGKNTEPNGQTDPASFIDGFRFMFLVSSRTALHASLPTWARMPNVTHRCRRRLTRGTLDCGIIFRNGKASPSGCHPAPDLDPVFDATAHARARLPWLVPRTDPYIKTAPCQTSRRMHISQDTDQGLVVSLYGIAV